MELFCPLQHQSSKGWQRNLRQGYFVEGAASGLNQLKQRISKMAPGSKITWLGEFTGADGRKQKGTEKLAYPPDSVVQEVKKFAAARNIEIAGPFKPSTP
jgi:hypothetical protein